MSMADKKILIINGPNLNLLGTREPEVYGSTSFTEFFKVLSDQYPGATLSYYQSNIEGELVDRLQDTKDFDGVILNAGAYTHTSIAIADCIAAIDSPVLEVHISNIMAREEERHTSLISKNCIGMISGFGLDSYKLALDYFLNYFGND